ncbi:MAG: hypothetical protein EGP06_03895 [SAR202 cluster bacterium]|jgi:mannitol-1-phosphate/altronate dehydrogenase|nr:MAG: hypothetical protein EGP09_04710 [SAR202 cluster bacterium]KAA1298633.1 MAG: hypothetical protein EGP06_03895 [SAR202 cluster bacterium]MQF96845.1 hypothetical protein [SAR202 cluster bacterium]|tara:strand:- start:288 stop:539 length:252 start_codon:yes stop_codon:yes gene_type:complete
MKNYYSILKEYQERNKYKVVSEPEIMLQNDENLEKLLKFVITPSVAILSLIMTAVILLALYLIFYALVEYNPTIWDMLGSKSI